MDNEKNTALNNLKDFKFNNSKNCCIAPYSTMNFDTLGKIRVCCYNNEFFLGKYPNDSLLSSWNNPKKQKFIDDIKKLHFPKGCEKCKFQIIQGNIGNALFTSFDYYDRNLNDEYPTVLNFEFGTICNYECIMCGGKWSSSIRKNREKLPPLVSPYDDEFVEQLKPFILNAKLFNFLGGEPFLNSLYYKILNYIMVRKPDADIFITTNGSVMNLRILNYILKLKNLKITVSLDSLKKDTYNFIRKNGNFETVMNNISEFKKHGSMCGIAFCPLIQNVYELPDIMDYCIENKFNLSINDVTEHLGGKIKGIHEGETERVSVWTDNDVIEETYVNNEVLIPEVALRTLPREKIKEIINYLEGFSYEKHIHYCVKYNDFVKSLYSLL